MQDPNEITELLREIRDGQREHLEEYKKVAGRSLEMQERGLTRQAQIGKTYRVALIASAALIVGIISLIIYLMSLLPRR